MYKILINDDILGYVEDIQDAKRICDAGNKYNSLSSESASYVYSIEKVFTDDIVDYIPRVYLQIKIRISPRKRFVIDIGVFSSSNISDIIDHVRNKDVYTYCELAVTYLIPKQNETVEEVKDRCLKTAIDIIDCHKEWKEYKEYEIYLDTQNGQERVERKDD
jgi:hypothetical protein